MTRLVQVILAALQPGLFLSLFGFTITDLLQKEFIIVGNLFLFPPLFFPGNICGYDEKVRYVKVKLALCYDCLIIIFQAGHSSVNSIFSFFVATIRLL